MGISTIVWNTEPYLLMPLGGTLRAGGLINLKCFFSGTKPTGSKQLITVRVLDAGGLRYSLTLGGLRELIRHQVQRLSFCAYVHACMGGECESCVISDDESHLSGVSCWGPAIPRDCGCLVSEWVVHAGI